MIEEKSEQYYSDHVLLLGGFCDCRKNHKYTFDRVCLKNISQCLMQDFWFANKCSAFEFPSCTTAACERDEATT